VAVLSNFHSHTNYCDGTESVLTMAEEACILGFTQYGVSSHAPVPFPCTWTMQSDKLQNYIEDVEAVKLLLKDKIEIYCGLEIDYIPETVGPVDYRHLLDYTVGSIHFVDQYEDGTEWEIDGSNTAFKKGLLEIFSNDAKKAIVRYFELTKEMIENDCPDIIGHLDKILIQNHKMNLADPNEGWYKLEMEEVLDCVKKSGAILEVNTRGMYKGYTEEPYPNYNALKSAFQKKIPIIISSDCHHPRELNLHFSDVKKELLNIGFEITMNFVSNEWIEQIIENKYVK
jgi:histidinol-phosphatase (PHP family)